MDKKSVSTDQEDRTVSYKGVTYILTPEKFSYENKEQLYNEFKGKTFEEAAYSALVGTEENEYHKLEKKPNLEFAYWRSVTETDTQKVRPLLFDTRKLINRSYSLNCAKLQMKSVSNIKGLKDRTHRVMNHSRTLNTAITTVYNAFSRIDTLTLADMFMNCALYAGVRLAGLTCAKTSLPSHCNKEPVLIPEDVLNFATFSTIVGMMKSLFKCKSVEEDRNSLINICHSLLKTRRLEMELRESHGLSPVDDYPNSTSDQKGSWLDFFHDIITAQHINKELIVYHTLRAIKDAASNITVAHRAASLQQNCEKFSPLTKQYFLAMKEMSKYPLSMENFGQYINELNELVSSKGTGFVNFSLHKMESMGGFLNKDWGKHHYTYYVTESQQPSDGNCYVINDETIKSLGILLSNKKSHIDRRPVHLPLMHGGFTRKRKRTTSPAARNRTAKKKNDLPSPLSWHPTVDCYEIMKQIKTYRNLLKKDQIVEAEKLRSELEIDINMILCWCEQLVLKYHL